MLLVWLLLAAVTLALAVHAERSAPERAVFVGTFYYVDDFYHYLGYVEQAGRGEVLLRSKLGPADRPATVFNLEWLAVGRMAAMLGGRPLLAYRLFGLVAAAAMVALIAYWLRRSGLPEKRLLAGTLLVATGGGLGGLLVALGWLQLDRAFDFRTGAFPFVETVANPHFVAGTALLLAALAAFAAGRRSLGLLVGTALGLVRPYDAALLVGIEASTTFLLAPRRQWPRRLLPLAALAPVLGYSAWTFLAVPRSRAFSSSRYAAFQPSPLDLLLTLGPALFLACLDLLGRPSEAAEGEREHQVRLWCWAVCSLVIVAFRPVAFSLQFLVGVGVPLLGLGAVALGRRRPGLLEATVPAMTTTAVLVVWFCTRPVPDFYASAERWGAAVALGQLCQPGDVVVSPEDIGLYAGALSACWPYMSHRASPDFWPRMQALRVFYDPATPPAARARFLRQACAAHVVLPATVPDGFLGEDAFRPQEVAIGRTATVVWTRRDLRTCRPVGP